MTKVSTQAHSSRKVKSVCWIIWILFALLYSVFLIPRLDLQYTGYVLIMLNLVAVCLHVAGATLAIVSARELWRFPKEPVISVAGAVMNVFAGLVLFQLSAVLSWQGAKYIVFEYMAG